MYVAGQFDSNVITFGSTLQLNNPSFSDGFVARFGAGGVGLPEAADAAALTLFPNPAHHTATLTGATAPTATLLDGLGRAVRTWPLAPGAADLDLRGLAPGLYTVRAGAMARRLVVE